jgi:hypothetical protein
MVSGDHCNRNFGSAIHVPVVVAPVLQRCDALSGEAALVPVGGDRPTGNSVSSIRVLRNLLHKGIGELLSDEQPVQSQTSQLRLAFR